MKRRRFLAITAAALCARPAAAQGLWQGRAFGADASIILTGPRDRAARAIAAVPALIARIEAQFSLHDPGSALSRLNRDGALPDPDPAFSALIGLCDQMHRATDGAFDPTVQPLWQALAAGRPCTAPLGWHHVGLSPLRLKPGMALTLNGIAQGFAADAVRALLSAHGFDHALIDLGEVAAIGGPFRLGLHDPAHGQLATATLSGGAMATSSPRATLVRGQPHILHPDGRPALWSSVTVEADSAALADALSTAACLMPRARLAALNLPGLRRIVLVDQAGNLSTL